MNSQNTDRDLLIAALNKNQVTYSQVSKIAEELINGVLKLKTLPMEKEFVFEYMNKKVYIDLNALRIGGLKYLNNILIDDILTTDELNEVYKILDQLKNELLNKADKIHKHDIADVNNLQSVLNDKADKEHTHKISDITDYEPYDDTEVRELIDERVTKKLYTSMDDIINDWINIPDNTIVLSTQGADQWSATFTYKYNAHRSLSFTIPKDEKDYLWTRFQGSNNNAWSNASVWRKIPVLTTSDNLVCNNVKEDNEIRLKNLEETSSTKGHKHTLADVVDFEPYDDTDIKAGITTLQNTTNKHTEQIANKADKDHTHDDRYAPIISYPTIEDMIIEWGNIPNNSIIVTNQGADQLSSTFTFKGSLWRSLTFTVPKITQNYLWTRFQGDGDPWTTPSPWRKIPLLDLDSKLIPDMLPNHKHKISDITDYKPYDDTGIKANITTLQNTTNEHTEQIANKSDKIHKHDINDLNDVVTNIDSQFEYRIADLTLVTNPYSWGEKYKINGEYQPSWQTIDKHTIKITMYQETQAKPNLRIVLYNADSTVVHNIEYELETDYWIPVINYRGYEVYTNNATIDLSLITIYGNFGRKDICRFSFEQGGRFYTTGAFRVYKNRTTEIIKPDLSLLSTMKAMIDLLYPIGSIYTSMNNINPSNFLGGTWKQIVDKFMYCSNTSLAEGGSKKITIDNLPAHTHSITIANDTIGDPDGAADTATSRYNYWRGTKTTTTNSTGSGTDYMPPYITVFAWYRTA